MRHVVDNLIPEQSELLQAAAGKCGYTWGAYERIPPYKHLERDRLAFYLIQKRIYIPQHVHIAIIAWEEMLAILRGEIIPELFKLQQDFQFRNISHVMRNLMGSFF